jgi:hypothetical protein
MAVLLAIFGVITLVGVLLTLKALFPKRTGDTPFCRKCRYNLTGTDLQAEDARCPECGSDLTSPKTILRGERRRRPVWVVSAVICLLLGLTPLSVIAVGTLRQVDWYTYKPTGWVLKDAESNDAKLAAKALAEIARRWRADELTPEQVDRLAEACLAEQARPMGRQAVCVPAVDLLDVLYMENLLSSEQTERFFANMVQFTPQVRPVVVGGEALYAGARLKKRGPQSTYRVRVRLDEIRLAGHVVYRTEPRFGGHSRGFSRYGESSLGRTVVAPEQPGSYAVALDLTLRVDERDENPLWLESSFSDRDWNDPALYRHKRTVTGSVGVLGPQRPDPFTLKHSVELDDALRDGVLASGFAVGPHGYTYTSDGGRRSLVRMYARVCLPDPCPIGLAFDVFVQFDGHRIGLGQITTSEINFIPLRHNLSLPQPSRLPDRATLILRSSKDAALRTPDLYEIWDGELWFEDLKVVELDESQPAWRQEVRFQPRIWRRDPSDDTWPSVAERRAWLSELPKQLRGRGDDRLEDALAHALGRLGSREAEDDQVFSIIGDILAGRAHSERTLRWHAREPERIDIGAMTPDERERYFDELLEFSPLVRPVVVAGQEFYVGVDWEDDAPREQFELYVNVKEIRVGELRRIGVDSGLRTPLGFSPRGYGLTGVPTSLGKYIELDEPGTWPVELDLEFRIHHADGSAGWPADDSELHSGIRTLTGQIEVLAEEPPGLFSLTHSAELDRAVAAAVRATDFRPESGTWVNGRPQPGLSVQVWFYEPLPVGLAFDVYAEFDGQRLAAKRPIIQSPWGKPGSSHGACVALPYAGEPPERVTLILRSSKSAATRTPDLYEIWDGELAFENIPVSAAARPDGRFADGRYAPTVRHPEPSQSDAASDGEP